MAVLRILLIFLALVAVVGYVRCALDEIGTSRELMPPLLTAAIIAVGFLALTLRPA